MWLINEELRDNGVGRMTAGGGEKSRRNGVKAAAV